MFGQIPATALLALLSILAQNVAATPVEVGSELEVRNPTAEAEPLAFAEADPEAFADAEALALADDESPVADGHLYKRALGTSSFTDASKGVTATCRWEWTGTRTVNQARCTVKDRKCEHLTVYAKLRLYRNNQATTTEKEIARFDNKLSCQGPEISDPHTHSWRAPSPNRIYKARVFACINVPGAPDKCYPGTLSDNPFNQG
jgi:hypothetical protein